MFKTVTEYVEKAADSLPSVNILICQGKFAPDSTLTLCVAYLPQY